MKGIAIAETTTVNWEKLIYWLLKALKKFKLLHRRIATNDFLY